MRLARGEGDAQLADVLLDALGAEAVQARRHHLHLLHRAPAHGAPRVMAHRPELHRCGSARRAMANAIWTAGRRARRRDDRDVCTSGRGSGLRRDRLEISKETSIGRDGRFAFKCLSLTSTIVVCQSSITIETITTNARYYCAHHHARLFIGASGSRVPSSLGLMFQIVHTSTVATLIHTAEGAIRNPAVRSTRRYWNTTL